VEGVVNLDAAFYKGKRVLVTGHTGFKGSWLCKLLLTLGAEVSGYALEPPTSPSIFALCGLQKEINSTIGDIRDLDSLKKAVADAAPEIIIHMAAQPIVRDSYKDPVYTYGTNVMGTVNILECVRLSDSVKSFVNVTTDKVYKNCEWVWGYRENDILGGFDPYANSKACSELVTESYKNSFLTARQVAVSTARAGNVIGGGDFAGDRIIPDCVRAAAERKPIQVRNPNSIRPYQHVLEPVVSYLTIARKQYEDSAKYAGSYNIGPDECDHVTTGRLVGIFCEKWGEGQTWENISVEGPHEGNLLKLDCSKAKSVFGFKTCWNTEYAVEKTVEWAKTYISGSDINLCMDSQIREFLGEWSKSDVQ